MKKIYKTAKAAAVDGGFGVFLDDSRLKTPARQELLLPNIAIAQEMAREWDAQGDQVIPASMKIVQLVSTALDRILPDPNPTIDYVSGFAEAEMLCYRAEHPSDLAARQAAAWQPLLDWAEIRFAAPLTIVRGIMPQPQPDDSLVRLHDVVAALDHWRLSALLAAVPVLGSLVLGLALLEKRLSAEEAFALAQLDENFQAERWGMDSEAADRRDAMRAELAAIEKFMKLLKE
jgi:chaperone required for assembly of F1-ATPase